MGYLFQLLFYLFGANARKQREKDMAIAQLKARLKTPQSVNQAATDRYYLEQLTKTK